MAADDTREPPLEGAKAALTPALEATTAILSLVASPKPPRFSREFNKRWREHVDQVLSAWEGGPADDHRGTFRAAVFGLLNLSVDSGDPDCLILAESLADVADHLENQPLTSRLIAAVNATLEGISEPGCLELKTFGERAGHFAGRIRHCLTPSSKPGERSDVLDHLFAEDTRERLERMYEALTVLPLDGYVLRLESQEIAQHAEHLDLWGIVHMARQLEGFVIQLGECGETEIDRAIGDIEALLARIAESLEVLDR